MEQPRDEYLRLFHAALDSRLEVERDRDEARRERDEYFRRYRALESERDEARVQNASWAEAWIALRAHVAKVHSAQPEIDPSYPRHRKEWDQALDEVEAMMDDLDPRKEK